MIVIVIFVHFFLFRYNEKYSLEVAGCIFNLYFVATFGTKHERS